MTPRYLAAWWSWWLSEHDWRKYCHVHDVIHWRWTHRGCCARQYRHPEVARIIRIVQNRGPRR